MPDLDRYLYDQLRSQASGVDVPAGDMDSVMARGRHRRHRRAGASAMAVLAAAGTVTGVVVSSSSHGGHGQISVGSPNGLPSATGTQLTWRVVPASAGLSDLSSLSSSGSTAYAVSTAPGVVPAGGSPAEQLYRTADGLSWTTATGPTGVSAAGVAVDGNRVYTVGTGLATAATGGSGSGAWTTEVSWTDNGGGSWQNSVLPVDLNAPAGAVTVNDQNVNVAAGPKGVIATVGVDATADLSKLVSGVSSQAVWTTDASGVEVLGAQLSSQCGFNAGSSVVRGLGTAPLTAAQQAAMASKLRAAAATQNTAAQLKGSGAAQLQTVSPKTPASFGPASKKPEGQISSTVPCVDASGQVTHYAAADQAYKVTKTYTWSQLGIGGQLAAALQGDSLVFYSSDGSNFQPVSLPAGASAVAVTATPDGFALLASDGNGPTSLVLQSADGSTWTPSSFGLPAGASGASVIGFVDGHLMVLGQTGATASAYTLLSDGWQTTALPVSYQAVSFGPMGVALVGVSGSGDPNSWQVLFSQDGVHWSSAALVGLSGGSVSDANVLVGSNQIVVTVTRPATTGPATQVQLVGTPS